MRWEARRRDRSRLFTYLGCARNTSGPSSGRRHAGVCAGWNRIFWCEQMRSNLSQPSEVSETTTSRTSQWSMRTMSEIEKGRVMSGLLVLVELRGGFVYLGSALGIAWFRGRASIIGGCRDWLACAQNCGSGEPRSNIKHRHRDASCQVSPQAKVGDAARLRFGCPSDRINTLYSCILIRHNWSIR